MNCALKAIEGVRLALHHDLEGLVVVVAAGFTGGHALLQLRCAALAGQPRHDSRPLSNLGAHPIIDESRNHPPCRRSFRLPPVRGRALRSVSMPIGSRASTDLE